MCRHNSSNLGVFRDGKPMSPLFQYSSERWRDVAQEMGAQYHLWFADELDALVKQKYPQFWSPYLKAAFSVMRVDIGRLCILHRHGGLYADLDVYPNRGTYAPASLAVQKVFLTGHRTAMEKCWLPRDASAMCRVKNILFQRKAMCWTWRF